ncbi:hypothetical protein EXIGLDRAFT_838290 [Exidia glandulosa HHB12029]|uniref:Integral membrane protein n=1 Tax=Exidia glandulosa HHB12029 TaxID=1314781 RepID=A0A165FZG1_EXIGL|nr:hypothetical protein EXIGLDRAFT_838290 [Exidia glandulosa HHB12029]
MNGKDSSSRLRPANAGRLRSIEGSAPTRRTRAATVVAPAPPLPRIPSGSAPDLTAAPAPVHHATQHLQVPDVAPRGAYFDLEAQSTRSSSRARRMRSFSNALSPSRWGRPRAASSPNPPTPVAAQRGAAPEIRVDHADGQASPDDIDPGYILARNQYNQQVVDFLDAIDPEVATMTNLSDMQNSLFVPNLGSYLDRARPFRMSKPPPPPPEMRQPRPKVDTPTAPPDELAAMDQHKQRRREEREDSDATETESVVQAGDYLMLPAGCVDWNKLTEDELRELDDYVRHLLHSKRERAKRVWRGFKQYVRTPLGAFIVIYASLLTFWGAAWVLFIIGASAWVGAAASADQALLFFLVARDESFNQLPFPTRTDSACWRAPPHHSTLQQRPVLRCTGWLGAGSRQAYFIEICDQVLTALFCVVGIGLSPFRTVDTYHMIYIAKYHSKALRLRRERALPPLEDDNDLPADEDTKAREHVLPPEEQAILEHHEAKFTRNHTFYRPHETATHRAFPLDLLIAVVCVLDCHSLFQIALGSATWSISYHHDYKRILTAVILSLSISCNITGGILIFVGNRKTRKNEVLERRLREALSEEAIRRKEKEKRKRIMHETVEEKEARLKAEQGPGLIDRVKEKLDEEGNASPGGIIDAVRGKQDGPIERSESADAVNDLDPARPPVEPNPRNAKSAKGSLDRPRP